ncbi:hypothetical protein ACIA98_03015 [Streptomyces sp. NPDC051366]|uniref:hypothetical protein n=1 Tax=Streptomyces sp. NPDC051366 TaxID=3365652 RepID=UPI00378EE7FB
MPAPKVFDHQARDYSPQLAYWMARAAALAYQDEPRIEAEARAWGFDQVRHHHTRFTPPFPLEDDGRRPHDRRSVPRHRTRAAEGLLEKNIP